MSVSMSDDFKERSTEIEAIDNRAPKRARRLSTRSFSEQIPKGRGKLLSLDGTTESIRADRSSQTQQDNLAFLLTSLDILAER
jgi:hypothetical protein